ncbi:DNA-dependent ATPase protein rad54 [Sorochytrium milnesiophthora]
MVARATTAAARRRASTPAAAYSQDSDVSDVPDVSDAEEDPYRPQKTRKRFVDASDDDQDADVQIEDDDDDDSDAAEDDDIKPASKKKAKQAPPAKKTRTTATRKSAKKDASDDGGSSSEGSPFPSPRRTPLQDMKNKANAGAMSASQVGGSQPGLLRRPMPRPPGGPMLAKPFKVPTFVKETNNLPLCANPCVNRALGMRSGARVMNRPLHDPEDEGAVILYTPPEMSATEKLKVGSSAKVLVHVVVDPVLGQKLRPHQIDGVKFMYDCVTGVKVPDVFGCIMADEMGLGKTLQCITLLWTLIRQSPEPGKPIIDKVVITCPSSLVKNWANELQKWLGNRIHPYACDNKGTKEQVQRDLRQFCTSQGRAVVNPVLIISYETLRINAPILGNTPIGLLLCDEGHRLKNSNSQTFQALNQLNIKRRVILSGTPIQNDLTEYFSLLNFSCPGLLGTESEFRKNFENPILRGRDAMASDKDREICQQKLLDLAALASKVIIRRTASLLSKYLPEKYEHVVFCRPSETQMQIYKAFTSSTEIKRLLSGSSTAQPLKYINFLKKLCSHPAQVDPEDMKSISAATGISLDNLYGKLNVRLSGKLQVLERMLHSIKTTTSDKIVLISNYTTTLDMLQQLCQTRGWGVLRLDGSMTIPKRQKLVNQFNDPTQPEFVFLLSSKAGGCGLNLIGANRLVLFDPDWNPASDAQAMARVWRDGQKKSCFLYRFMCTGTIEEKIFQRQCHKQMLSNCVVDEEQEVERHFSLENLRMLFALNDQTMSDTHDTFKCKRCVNGRQFKPPPSKDSNEVSARNITTDMSLWSHYSELELGKVPDPMLRECGKGVVSFVFQQKSHDLIMPKGDE